MKNVLKTSVIIFVIMVLTFVVHELAHFLMAKALGENAIMSINRVRPVTRVWHNPGGATFIAAAGPIVTILTGVFGFIWAVRRSSLRRATLGLNIILVAFVHRLLATIVSLNNANDEMRVSMSLGLGPWTLPILVTSVLLVMSIYAFKKIKPGYGYLISVWLGSSFAVTLVIFGEPYLPRITW